MADEKSIAVVGGGLVGTLQAIYMAKEGYEVHLYESRKDLRATGTCTYERRFAATYTLSDSAVKSVRIFALTCSRLHQLTLCSSCFSEFIIIVMHM